MVVADFVTSAASAADLPRDGAPELAVVGRSNVGKSSLINALVGRRIARTSAAPGKTRLINVYRLDVSAHGRGRAFYLVDLPGYGYARGAGSAESFRPLAEAYAASRWSADAASRAARAALLLVDARHPGLDNDLAAYDWLASLARPAAVVATKIDKLSRAERRRASDELEMAFNGPVLAVSAATGEGMKDLWQLIDRLLSKHPPRLKPRQA